MAENEYCQEKKKKLDMFQFVGEMLQDFNPDCKLYLKGNVFDLASLEYNIEGAGYGDLVNLVYKAITLGFQQDLVDRIVDDYKTKLAEADAPMDEPMGEPMGAPMEAPME